MVQSPQSAWILGSLLCNLEPQGLPHAHLTLYLVPIQQSHWSQSVREIAVKC